MITIALDNAEERLVMNQITIRKAILFSINTESKKMTLEDSPERLCHYVVGGAEVGSRRKSVIKRALA
jgi:hypothetical protein